MPNVGRDPGCRLNSASILRPYINQFAYSLVLFDREGSGADEQQSRIEIEQAVEADLARNGWSSRNAAIVVDPEIEAWVWSDSPHVSSALGWINRQTDMRDWIKSNTSFWQAQNPKPDRPKEAMREVLREVRKPVSTSIFQDLSKSVGVDRCTDPAFAKLKKTLTDWFSSEESNV